MPCTALRGRAPGRRGERLGGGGRPGVAAGSDSPASASAPRRPGFVRQSLESPRGRRPAARKAIARVRHIQAARPPASVLVIDDNMDTADSLARFLRVAVGHEVRVAYDGAAGVRMAGERARRGRLRHRHAQAERAAGGRRPGAVDAQAAADRRHGVRRRVPGGDGARGRVRLLPGQAGRPVRRRDADPRPRPAARPSSPAVAATARRPGLPAYPRAHAAERMQRSKRRSDAGPQATVFGCRPPAAYSAPLRCAPFRCVRALHKAARDSPPSQSWLTTLSPPPA